MSDLELFAIGIIAVIVYIVVTAISGLMGGQDFEEFTQIGWLAGCVLFVLVILLWAKGEPFPIGR